MIRGDVLAVLATLHGARRTNTIVALRSLFAFCKRNGRVFRNPTGRIKVGEHGYGVIQPLRPVEVGDAIAASTTPVARLGLTLAAIHAARSGAIRALRLDDVDLAKPTAGDRRAHPPSRRADPRHPAPLLDHRRTRWPNTANAHLIVNQQTGLETGSVSSVWVMKVLGARRRPRSGLRVDRQLEDALIHGPDPLHLAAVFGLDQKTAIG